MLKYYNYYEKSYEKFTPDWFLPENAKEVDSFLEKNSESVIDFIEKYQDQFGLGSQMFFGKKVLVLGCGFGGLATYLAKCSADVTAIDVSSLAIMGAKEIAQNKGLSIDYKVIDICLKDSSKQITTQFDYIIDDHLFHCLTTQQDRSHYLEFVKDKLSDENSLFMLETMAYHDHIQTPLKCAW